MKNLSKANRARIIRILALTAVVVAIILFILVVAWAAKNIHRSMKERHNLKASQSTTGSTKS